MGALTAPPAAGVGDIAEPFAPGAERDLELAEPTPGAQEEDHGRIGYGRYGRWTPLALALLLIMVLSWIGFAGGQSDPSPAPAQSGDIIGKPAPSLALTLFDGTTLSLNEPRGSIVVVNFWASWCPPCQREAPALQAIHTAAEAAGAPVRIVGVGLKDDTDAAARAFVAELGLTYPLGRDTGGGERSRGPIELAFGISPYYPTTVFVDPSGTVVTVHVGEMTGAQIDATIRAIRAGGV